MKSKYRTQQEAIDALKPRLTCEFLDTLKEYLLIYGYDGDFVAAKGFVSSCFYDAGQYSEADELIDIKPYEFED